jgi:signal peptidase I
MSFQDWFIIFIAVQFIHGLGTWKLYIKAGEKPWAAFIPVYNAVVLMRIINREWWLVFLLFLPVINVIMFIVIWVEIARSFGKKHLSRYFSYHHYTRFIHLLPQLFFRSRSC